MGIQQHQSIRARQAGEAVVALSQLCWSLTKRRPCFRRCLIKGRRRAASAVPEENDFSYTLLLQVFHTLLDVERNLLEIHKCLVVLETRVKTKNSEAASGQFRALGGGELVARAMNCQ